MRRRRLKAWGKWGFTIAAVVMVAVAVASKWWCFMWYAADGSGGGVQGMGIGRGVLVVARLGAAFRRQPGWDFYASPGWRWGFSSEAAGERAVLGFMLVHVPGAVDTYSVTFLYPVLLASIPAAILWYKDRRRFGPHVCGHCGYDRRGLAADAKCPECGTVPTPIPTK